MTCIYVFTGQKNDINKKYGVTSTKSLNVACRNMDHMDTRKVSRFLSRHLEMERTIGSEQLVKMRRLLNHLDEKMTFTSGLCTTIFTGSKADGFDFRASDHDMMWIFDGAVVVRPYDNIRMEDADKTIFIMDNTNCRPGFTLLKLLQLGPLEGSAKFVVALESFNGSQYLSSLGLKCALMGLETGESYLHGPCVTITNEQGMEIDHAYSLHCRSWPTDLTDFCDRTQFCVWPSRKIVHRIVKCGCHVVAIGDKYSSHFQIQWRISFAQAETILVGTFNHVQFKTYALLKMFLKECIDRDQSVQELLCSYFMKTIMFHAIEHSKADMWVEDNIVQCFWYCFTVLFECVKTGYLPNYFMLTNNMIHPKVTGQNKKRLLQILNVYQKTGYSCLFQCQTLQSLPRKIKENNSMFPSPKLPRDHVAEECCQDICIWHGLLYYRVPEPSSSHALRVLYNLFMKCQEDSLLDVGLLYFMRAITYSSSESIAEMTSHVQCNKAAYRQIRRDRGLLRLSSATDVSSGALSLATFYYNVGSYSKTSHVATDVVYNCQRNCTLLEHSPDEYQREMCGKGYTLLQKAKRSFVYPYVISREQGKLYPAELDSLCSAASANTFGDVEIPALPYAIFLLVLCAYRLHNNDQATMFFKDLLALRKYPVNGMHAYPILQNLVDICQSMLENESNSFSQLPDNTATVKSADSLLPDNTATVKSADSLLPDNTTTVKSADSLLPDNTATVKSADSLLHDNAATVKSADSLLPDNAATVKSADSLLPDNTTTVKSADSLLSDNTATVKGADSLLPDNTTTVKSADSLLPDNTATVKSADSLLPDNAATVKSADSLLPDNTTTVKRADSLLPDITTTVKSADSLLPDNTATVKGADSLLPDNTTTVKSADSLLPDNTATVKSADSLLPDNAATVKSADSLLPDNAATVKSADSLLPDNTTTVKSADSLLSDITATVKGADSLLPDNTTTVKSADSLLPDNTATVKSADSLLPDNEATVKSADSLLPDNAATVKSADSLLPDNTTTVKSADSLLPDNTTTVKGADSLLPDNTTTVKRADSLLPDNTATVKGADSLLPDNTTTVKRADSLLPDNAATVKSADSLLPDNAATVKSADSLLPDNAATVKSADSLLPDNTATVKSADSLLPDNAATVKSADSLLPDNAATVKSADSLLPDNAATVKSADSLLPDNTATVKSADSLLPDNAATVKSADSLLPDNAATVKSADSLLSDNTTTVKSANSLLSDNTATVKSADSLLPDNTTTVKGADSLLPDNTTTVKSADSLLPDNTATVKGADSLLPDSTTTVKSADSLLSDNTTTVKSADSLLPDNTATVKGADSLLSDNTASVKGADSLLSDNTAAVKTTVVNRTVSNRGSDSRVCDNSASVVNIATDMSFFGSPTEQEGIKDSTTLDYCNIPLQYQCKENIVNDDIENIFATFYKVMFCIEPINIIERILY
ncbi:uncharacterized protein [Argopecten irradians]|uniref:uncharacterized protein n=1 Tax=Argopecten irradians TaxID=31199 RepID=UPI00371E5F5F